MKFQFIFRFLISSPLSTSDTLHPLATSYLLLGICYANTTSPLHCPFSSLAYLLVTSTFSSSHTSLPPQHPENTSRFFFLYSSWITIPVNLRRMRSSFSPSIIFIPTIKTLPYHPPFVPWRTLFPRSTNFLHISIILVNLILNPTINSPQHSHTFHNNTFLTSYAPVSQSVVMHLPPFSAPVDILHCRIADRVQEIYRN